MKAEKQELQDVIRDYIKCDQDQSNHWLRRFYRCFIDGSYEHHNSGYEGYKKNVVFIHSLKDYPTDKMRYNKTRTRIISLFADFLDVEFVNISRTIIHNVIVKEFGDLLEFFNQQLIDDFFGLTEETIDDYFTSTLLVIKSGGLE